MSDPHSPSAAGYVAMWLWSVCFCGLLVGAWIVVEDGEPGGMLFVLYGWVFAAVGSLPVAPFGLVLLHHLCRGVARQWVHVLVATVVGAVCGLLYGLLFDGFWGMVPLLAASVGLARWAVVPTLPSYRSRTRRRRPVDDDFAGTPPRW